jgi:hypothetical protein
VAGCEYSRFVQDLLRIGESVNSWLWDRRSIYRVSRRPRAGVEQDTFRLIPVMPNLRSSGPAASTASPAGNATKTAGNVGNLKRTNKQQKGKKKGKKNTRTSGQVRDDGLACYQQAPHPPHAQRGWILRPAGRTLT